MIGSTAIFLNHEIYLVRLECLLKLVYMSNRRSKIMLLLISKTKSQELHYVGISFGELLVRGKYLSN
jgi:hypothetical protein